MVLIPSVIDLLLFGLNCVVPDVRHWRTVLSRHFVERTSSELGRSRLVTVVYFIESSSQLVYPLIVGTRKTRLLVHDGSLSCYSHSSNFLLLSLPSHISFRFVIAHCFSLRSLNSHSQGSKQIRRWNIRTWGIGKRVSNTFCWPSRPLITSLWILNPDCSRWQNFPTGRLRSICFAKLHLNSIY